LKTIPKKIVNTLNLELNGSVVLSGCTADDVHGFFAPCRGGGMQITKEAWGTFIEKNELKINQTVMLLFDSVEENYFSTDKFRINLDVI
jgi:hypothetical protein